MDGYLRIVQCISVRVHLPRYFFFRSMLVRAVPHKRPI
ncbi:hypothetical protein EVA_06263 [gut metagenome]|uniref:Uncharacterized protein n=1 Tax=gut metagenome TaxID=749906 RepID=J9GXY6_9ZZZZ